MKIYRCFFFPPFVQPSSFHQSHCYLQSQTDGWHQRYSGGEHQHCQQLLFVKYSSSPGDTLLISVQEVHFAQIPCSGAEVGVKRGALRLEPDTYSGSVSQTYMLRCFLFFFSPLTLILKSAHLSQSIFYKCRR